MEAQDIVVLLRIIDLGNTLWTLESLAADLNVDSRAIYVGLERMQTARLLSCDRKFVMSMKLLEFLEHGMPVIQPTRLDQTRIVRGVPTAFASPALVGIINQRPPLVVWEHERGTHEGKPVKGIIPGCAELAMKFAGMHNLLSLYDCFAVGHVRERTLAREKLKSIFDSYSTHCAFS